jgi:hypothetical protein
MPRWTAVSRAPSCKPPVHRRAPSAPAPARARTARRPRYRPRPSEHTNRRSFSSGPSNTRRRSTR